MQPRYDVFISYHADDQEWVRQTLLPGLECAGLRICVAGRDFAIGVPRLINIEQAIAQSHKTLLVITPGWLADQWHQFETLILQTSDLDDPQRRLLPLILQPVALPPRLSLFTPLDWAQAAAFGDPLQRLIASIRAALPAPAHTTTSGASYPPNPFGDIGRIADPARFFDREDLLRRIFEELGKGVNLSLVGDSQIGKSSLLEMVCAQGPQRLNLPPAAFAYLSLELVDNEGEFYEALCEALGITPACRGYQLTRALRGRRYVLCLDEIEKMVWDGFTIGLRSHLRGLADGPAAPLKLVIASHSPLSQCFSDATELTSPLANICRQIDVGPFAPEVARAFLAARLSGTGIDFSEEQIAELLARSGGHPAWLQSATADLYDLLAGR